MASLNVTYNFTNGTIAEAGQVNQNFTDVETFANTKVVQIDGSVQAPSIALEDAAVTSPKLAAPTLTLKIDNFTLASTDANCTMQCNKATPLIATIPTSTVAFAIGSVVTFIQYGDGKLEIKGDTGVTINSANGRYLRTKYSMASLVKISNTEWILSGDTVLV